MGQTGNKQPGSVVQCGVVQAGHDCSWPSCGTALSVHLEMGLATVKRDALHCAPSRQQYRTAWRLIHAT